MWGQRRRTDSSSFVDEANDICAERQSVVAEFSPEDRSRDAFEPVAEALAAGGKGRAIARELRLETCGDAVY